MQNDRLRLRYHRGWVHTNTRALAHCAQRASPLGIPLADGHDRGELHNRIWRGRPHGCAQHTPVAPSVGVGCCHAVVCRRRRTHARVCVHMHQRVYTMMYVPHASPSAHARTHNTHTGHQRTASRPHTLCCVQRRRKLLHTEGKDSWLRTPFLRCFETGNGLADGGVARPFDGGLFLDTNWGGGGGGGGSGGVCTHTHINTRTHTHQHTRTHATHNTITHTLACGRGECWGLVLCARWGWVGGLVVVVVGWTHIVPCSLSLPLPFHDVRKGGVIAGRGGCFFGCRAR